MAPSKLLDTHIHLWPSTSVSPTNHGWMTPGHFLTRRHGILDYKAATRASPVQPSAFIYVETDRYLSSLTPDLSNDEVVALSESLEAKKAVTQKLQRWAHEPLEELKFLRRIVEGTPQDGDGFDPTDGAKMVGCVIWAPFHLPTQLFELYLQIAQETSGPRLWQRVVGFRYLLQAVKEESTLRTLLESQEWLRNVLQLRSGRGGKGWAFDIGVDTHSGGVWQVEAAADMVQTIRGMEGGGANGTVKFVLNHLCKPDLSTSASESSARWLSAMKRVAAEPDVYMKFSGAFNEFAPSPTPTDIPSLVDRLQFYTRHVFELLGPGRTMFGSDWPVCNVGGPVGDQNWNLWRQVVERTLEGLNIEDTESVWWRAGCRAYEVGL